MKVLGIYGAGGAGREVLDLARSLQPHPDVHLNWEEIILVDDFNPDRAKIKINGARVMSFDEITAECAENGAKLEFIIAIGEPASRKKLYEKVINSGFRCVSLVSPKAHISDTAIIEDGSIIQAYCVVSCNTTVKRNSYLNFSALIGHDCVIGANCVISSNVSFGGGTVVGDTTYIGLNTPIKEKSTIGSDSVIGMGSVVSRDIPDNVIALGNPARGMKHKDERKVFK